MDEIAAGAAVYVDTNIFIYFIEATPGHYDRAAAAFTQLAEKSARVVTNELTVAECLYLPAREENRALIAVYERLFDASGDVTLLPLTGGIARRAAIAGGAMGLKLMDAIHYLSALESGCSHFLTSDSQFKSGPDLQVELV